MLVLCRALVFRDYAIVLMKLSRRQALIDLARAAVGFEVNTLRVARRRRCFACARHAGRPGRGPRCHGCLDGEHREEDKNALQPAHPPLPAHPWPLPWQEDPGNLAAAAKQSVRTRQRR